MAAWNRYIQIKKKLHNLYQNKLITANFSVHMECLLSCLAEPGQAEMMVVSSKSEGKHSFRPKLYYFDLLCSKSIRHVSQ